jgi:hypothetical protein
VLRTPEGFARVGKRLDQRAPHRRRFGHRRAVTCGNRLRRPDSNTAPTAAASDTANMGRDRWECGPYVDELHKRWRH